MSLRLVSATLAAGVAVALAGTAAPADAVAPLAPVTGLAAQLTATGDGFAVTWTPSTSAGVTGVTVRRAPGTTPPTSTSGTKVAEVGASVTTVKDKSLAVPKTFSYAVFAHDGSGHLSTAATVTVSTVYPPALQGVVAATDGTAVAHAVVTAVPAAGGTTLTALTDSRGRYVLTDAQGGASYSVCVDPSQAHGAPTAGWVARCAGASVSAVPGHVVTVAAIALHTGAAVFGTVVSATTGTPAAGATVAAFPVGGAAPTATTSTRADGTFRLTGLPGVTAGYVVCVDGSADGTAGTVAGLTPACAGGATWGGTGTAPPSSGATVVKGAAGAVTRAVIVPLHPWNLLHGSITENYSGDGISTVEVTAWSGGSVVATGATDGNGAFAVKVPDGSYAVCFDASQAGWDSQDIRAPAGFADHCAGVDSWYVHSAPTPGATTYSLAGGQTADAGAVVSAAAGLAPVDEDHDPTTAGHTVYLFTATGILAGTGAVDSGGYWEVDRLAAGAYWACLQTTDGPQGPGGVCLDPSGLPTSPPYVSWDPGTTPGVDFPLYPYAALTIGWGAVTYAQVYF